MARSLPSSTATPTITTTAKTVAQMATGSSVFTWGSCAPTRASMDIPTIGIEAVMTVVTSDTVTVARAKSSPSTPYVRSIV